MKKLTFTTCAFALSSVALAQMIVPADARSRHHRRGHAMSRFSPVGGGQNVTGGRAGRDNSAAGGNASQPSRPRAQGGGGAGGGGGQ